MKDVEKFRKMVIRNGDIFIVHNETTDKLFRKDEKVIDRASHVDYNNDTRRWEITTIDKVPTVIGWDDTREGALKKEVSMVQELNNRPLTDENVTKLDLSKYKQ